MSVRVCECVSVSMTVRVCECKYECVSVSVSVSDYLAPLRRSSCPQGNGGDLLRE